MTATVRPAPARRTASAGAAWPVPTMMASKAGIGGPYYNPPKNKPLIGPPLLGRFLGALAQADFLAVDFIDPVAGNVVMLAAGLRVVLRELDAVALDVVDGADGLAVGADDLHVLADIGNVHAWSPCRLFARGRVRASCEQPAFPQSRIERREAAPELAFRHPAARALVGEPRRRGDRLRADAPARAGPLR